MKKSKKAIAFIFRVPMKKCYFGYMRKKTIQAILRKEDIIIVNNKNEVIYPSNARP